jgi:hypothetical protein
MYTIIKKASDFIPANYAVFVEVAYYKNCGFKPDEKCIGRLGAAKDMEGVAKLIANDRQAMGDTFGGLIDAVSTKGRKYLVFKCDTWEAVAI